MFWNRIFHPSPDYCECDAIVAEEKLKRERKGKEFGLFLILEVASSV